MILSLFVLPGLGHISVGQKKKGYLLAFLVCFIFLLLVVFFEWKLVLAVNKIDDPRQIFSQILPLAGEVWSANPLIYWSGLALAALLWAYAAIDLWYIWKKEISDNLL